MVYKILFCCGSGVATSAMASSLCKKKLEEKGLQIEAQETRVQNIAESVSSFNPNAVVTTTNLAQEAIPNIKLFKGMAFITGVGADKVVDEIYDYLTTL